MTPHKLRYDEERATRYSDPPTAFMFEGPHGLLLVHYGGLLELRNAAKAYYATLVDKGIFESVPTLTSETRKGRPGTFWRAVFSQNSPEVRAGHPRKQYIGSDEAKLQEWKAWIARTRLAMKLSRLIDDIGNTLKHDHRTTSRTADMMAAAMLSYNLTLEELAP